MKRAESEVVNNPMYQARIQAEGCLECGGAVHVLPEGVLCQDCDKLIPHREYRRFFAIEAGYEDVIPKDNAPK